MKNCPIVDMCWKIKIVMDKDMPDQLAAKCIRDVCGRCTEQIPRKSVKGK